VRLHRFQLRGMIPLIGERLRAGAVGELVDDLLVVSPLGQRTVVCPRHRRILRS
jgi:hypothetical protein